MASSRRAPAVDNISTYHSAGTGSPDYTSMGTWEAATDIDLVTATQGETLLVWNGTHDDNLICLGATTNSSYFRRLIGDIGSPGVHHGGVRAAGSIISTTYDGGNTIIFHEKFDSVQDLALTGALNSANNRYLIDLNESDQDVVGCVIYALANAGAGSFRTILNRDPDCAIINTIIENCEGVAGVGDIYNIQTTGNALDVMNCTLYGTGAVGARNDTANLTKFTNVIIDGYTTCVSGTISGSGSNYMLTSDSTAVGANSVATGNPTYVNEGGNDYHLATGDTSGAKTGVDPTTYDEDIDLNTVTTWWMGANSANASPPVNTVPANGKCINTYEETAVPGVSVAEGSGTVIAIATTCTAGCTLTYNITGTSVMVSGNGTNAATLSNGASITEYNTVLDTLTMRGSTPDTTITVTVIPTDGTLNDSDQFTVLCDPASITITGTNANVIAAVASLQVRLLPGQTHDTISVNVVDDTGGTPLEVDSSFVVGLAAYFQTGDGDLPLLASTRGITDVIM